MAESKAAHNLYPGPSTTLTNAIELENIMAHTLLDRCEEERTVAALLTVDEQAMVTQYADYGNAWPVLCSAATNKSINELTPTDKWALLVLRVHAAHQEYWNHSNLYLLRRVRPDVISKLNTSEDRTKNHPTTAVQIWPVELFEWLNPRETSVGDWRSKQLLCAIYLALRQLCVLTIETPVGYNSQCTVRLPWCANSAVNVRLLSIARAVVGCYDARRAKQERGSWSEGTTLPAVLVNVICEYLGDHVNIVWNHKEHLPRYGRDYIPYDDLVTTSGITPQQTEQLFHVLRQDEKELIQWKSFLDLPPCLLHMHTLPLSRQ